MWVNPYTSIYEVTSSYCGTISCTLQHLRNYMPDIFAIKLHFLLAQIIFSRVFILPLRTCDFHHRKMSAIFNLVFLHCCAGVFALTALLSHPIRHYSGYHHIVRLLPRAPYCPKMYLFKRSS